MSPTSYQTAPPRKVGVYRLLTGKIGKRGYYTALTTQANQIMTIHATYTNSYPSGRVCRRPQTADATFVHFFPNMPPKYGRFGKKCSKEDRDRVQTGIRRGFAALWTQVGSPGAGWIAEHMLDRSSSSPIFHLPANFRAAPQRYNRVRNTWLAAYPAAWLAVDLRSDGRIGVIAPRLFAYRRNHHGSHRFSRAYLPQQDRRPRGVGYQPVLQHSDGEPARHPRGAARRVRGHAHHALHRAFGRHHGSCGHLHQQLHLRAMQAASRVHRIRHHAPGFRGPRGGNRPHDRAGASRREAASRHAGSGHGRSAPDGRLRDPGSARAAAGGAHRRLPPRFLASAAAEERPANLPRPGGERRASGGLLHPRHRLRCAACRTAVRRRIQHASVRGRAPLRRAGAHVGRRPRDVRIGFPHVEPQLRVRRAGVVRIHRRRDGKAHLAQRRAVRRRDSGIAKRPKRSPTRCYFTRRLPRKKRWHRNKRCRRASMPGEKTAASDATRPPPSRPS